MTVSVLDAVMALTRGWIGIYTRYAPSEIAAERRAEIECDLWEMQHDSDLQPGLRPASIALARVINGIPDDLAWAFDNLALEEQLIIRRLLALTAASLIVTSLWAVPSFFLNGRKEVAKCAATMPQLESGTDLRFELMRCAGAFFSASR